MRVLYHHRTQANDGQAVHVRSLLGAFEAEGHAVHEVGLVRHFGPSADSGAAPGAAGRRRWGWVTRLPRALRELAEYAYSAPARNRILRAAVGFEPDVLYERYAFGNAGGVLAARRLSLPLVLEVNAPMVQELSLTRGLSFPGLARRMEAHVLGAADLVCVVTEVLGEMLVDLGVDPKRLLVTPNGVHLERYEYPDRERARAKARLDLGLGEDAADGEVVLGFVGYYRDWHRLDLAIDALGEPGLESTRLVLIGEGPARAELERVARQRGVDGRVVFAGARPHQAIPELLPALDVALVPAINPYASPLKLHEYMAASVPTIAPDQPNLREVLTDGRDALLVPPGDGAALVAGIARLVGDPELRADLGAAARATVEARDLTWRGNARRVIAALSERRS